MRTSPTPRLMLGFAVTIVAVVLYSWFTLRQVASLRELQAETVSINRKDSLQLLRIQNSLNSLGLAVQDMTSSDSGYPIAAFEPQLRRILADLEDALRVEASLAPHEASTTHREFLAGSLEPLRKTIDDIFSFARAGRNDAATALVLNDLRSQQSTLSARIARILVRNNEFDEQTGAKIEKIYRGVERDLYVFLSAVLIAIGVTGAAVVVINRRVFAQVAALSEQKSTLARKLISMQEEILRSISRELHDEFGQILTAIGAMLSRLQRKNAGVEEPLKKGLSEIHEMTQEALDKVRSLSQMLHPAVIDDYGLEKAVEWYLPMFEKQTGIRVTYQKRGSGPSIKEEAAIHVYRILQEALNNVARHSGSKTADVRVEYGADRLLLEIEDRGTGLPAREPSQENRGLGLVAMRERAELVEGRLHLQSAERGGTLVSLEVPLTRLPHE